MLHPVGVDGRAAFCNLFSSKLYVKPPLKIGTGIYNTFSIIFLKKLRYQTNVFTSKHQKQKLHMNSATQVKCPLKISILILAFSKVFQSHLRKIGQLPSYLVLLAHMFFSSGKPKKIKLGEGVLFLNQVLLNLCGTRM